MKIKVLLLSIALLACTVFAAYAQVPIPSIDPPGPIYICAGDSVTLQVDPSGPPLPPGINHYWTTGDTAWSITVAPATTTTYRVIAYDPGGDTSSSQPVTVFVTGGINLDITPSGPTAFCDGESVTLTADTGYATYLWSNSETTQAVTVSAAGSYSVVATDTTGCVGYDTVDVTVSAAPTANITPDPADACLGEDLNLSGNPAGGSNVYITRFWNGDTGPLSSTNIDQPVFNSSSAGTYTLVYGVTDDNGCTGTDTIDVSVAASQSASILSLASVYCETDLTVWPSANPSGGTFSGDLGTGNSFSPGSLGPGTYEVIYTPAGGTCYTPDTVSVEVLDSSACGTGIGEATLAELISMYPNPANDRLYIALDEIDVTNINVRILDATGKVVMSDSRAVRTNFNLYLGHLPAGSYMVQLKTDEWQYVNKVVLVK